MMEHHPYRALFKLDGYPAIFGTRFYTAVSSWIDFTLVFVLLIGTFEASAFQIGLASAFFWLPTLVLGPSAGAISDRYPVQHILHTALAARVGAVCLLLTASSVEVFMLGILLRSAGNLGGALPQAVRAIVPASLLADNARLVITVEQGTRLIAPLVVAFLALFHQPQYGFILSILLALLSIPLPARIGSAIARLPSTQTSTHTPCKLETSSSTPDANASIWALLKASPHLSTTLWTATAYCFTAGLIDPLVPLMLRALPDGAQFYGVVMGAASVGALAGAHFSTCWCKRWGDIETMQWCLLGTGSLTMCMACIVLCNITMASWIICVYWMLAGVCYATMLTCLGITLQTHAPPGRIGAVTGKIQSIRLTALVAGPIVGASMVKYLSVGAALLAAAIFAMISFFVLRRKKP